jgi:hypothetical protein
MGEKISTTAIEISARDGVARIEPGATLTRLHYFDGKFLRADALTLEQDYHRALVRLSNLAGGWGVVHGLGAERSGDLIVVSPGLAITPAGSTVLLTGPFEVEIAKLIAAATPAPSTALATGVAGSADFAECVLGPAASAPESGGTGYYEVTVGPAEALCGNEEVYGKLCEDACVTDSQRPYWREGLVLRLRPITLKLPDSLSVALGDAHLRNRVASAYFATEPWLTASLLSAQGLACGIWCNPAMLYARDEVPIGILVREGGATKFIDAWSARRELMDTQARGYWQGRMMMRPWNVFIAQILQFQCQLSGVFTPGSRAFDPGDDECARLRAFLGDSTRDLQYVREMYADGNRQIMEMLKAGERRDNADTLKAMDGRYKYIEQIARKFSDAGDSFKPLPRNRMLLNRGFVQLPSAGYLPVIRSSQPVNEQVQRMFGEGVDLHFCTARPDYIPHAVEEAQHMERISLTRGLDDPANKEQVQIFVPNGEIVDALGALDGTHWFTGTNLAVHTLFMITMRMTSEDEAAIGQGLDVLLKAYADSLASHTDMPMSGVSRTTRLDGGGAALTAACRLIGDSGEKVSGVGYMMGGELRGLAPGKSGERAAKAASVRTIQDTGLYADLRITADPFAKQEGDQVPLNFEVRFFVSSTSARGEQRAAQVITGDGSITIESIFQVDTGVQGLTGTARIHVSTTSIGDLGIGAGAQAPETLSVSVPISLQREGDAHGGLLLLGAGLDRKSHTALPTVWAAQWSGAPRNAVFGIRQGRMVTRASLSGYEDNLRSKVRGTTGVGNAMGGIGGALGGIGGQGGSDALGLGGVYGMDWAAGGEEFVKQGSATTSILPFAKLREADAPLVPENPVRLAALNTLAIIAEATDDDAFLMRARRLLFPDATIEAAIRVRATMDWVMFRRQRKAVCDVQGRRETPVQVDAFQAWHLKLDNLERLAALANAIDTADEHELARRLRGLKLERVDVLHYTDAALTPSETSSRINADWQAKSPGRKVVLGRVWETAPRVGQGWQNNGRLRRLAEILAAQIDPPAIDVVHALAKAPRPLADPAFDGGMLLVTYAPKQGVETVLHRVSFLAEGEFDAVNRLLTGDPQHLVGYVDKNSRTEYVAFERSSNTPLPGEIDRMRALFDAFHKDLRSAYGFVVQGSPDRPLALPEHVAICRALGTTPNTDVGGVGVADFGRGAFAATLVFLRTAVIGTPPEPPPVPAVQRYAHRVLIGSEATYQLVQAGYRQGPAALLAALQMSVYSTIVHFDGSNVVQAELDAVLTEYLQRLGGSGGLVNYAGEAFVRDNATDAALGQAEFEVINAAMSTLPPSTARRIGLTDFGSGTSAASIFYIGGPVRIPASPRRKVSARTTRKTTKKRKPK